MNDLRTDETGAWIDPRICVEHTGYEWDPEQGIHVAVEGSTQHDFSRGVDYPCEHCRAFRREVREAFFQWQYETVIVQLTDSLRELGHAVRRLQ